MSSSNDIVIQLLMLDAGIVPFSPDTWVPDSEKMNIIDKRIESLGPDDRRRVKRKFRKLWRKAVRVLDAERESQGLSRIHSEMCGLNNPSPTIRQKQTRRHAVLWLLRKEIQECR